MTLTMALHITFPAARGRDEINLHRATAVQIESSWKEFTDRAEITMPRNIRSLKGEFKYADIFKAGDPVIIRLGYGAGELPTEFTGYIADVSEGIPVVLRCEDEMYQLKRGSVSVVSKGISLKNLLKQACKGYEIDCPDMQLGAVRYANVAPIKILEDIKKEIGLHSYFDGKILRCGVIYGDQSDVKPVDILLERNAVSESLNKKAETDEVEIKAISILKDGKKLSVTVGRKGGTSVQRTYVGITVKAELEKRANSDLKKYQAQGFDGSITLFGIPRIQHGVKIHLKSEFLKNMEGLFYVDSVKKSFDNGGYRQDVTLGERAAV
ncbi:MAG: hypothetical protein LBN27_05890 [Prevotellaceae bacterium]|jgi:hypothetical protein|nr:hypothetical protein [Prevotellaceae bacterium]